MVRTTMLRKPLLIALLCLCCGGALFSADSIEEPVRVLRPRVIPTEVLPVERTPFGVPDDYKPCVVHLGAGELLAVAFHQHRLEGKALREDMLLFRSKDAGHTWSDAEPLGLLGREPYFSQLQDGTLFLTTHLLENDVRNELGYTHSYLHRSIDGGKTWQSARIASDSLPEPPTVNWILTSRNVLQLDDGTLILGVSAPGGRDYLWRSADQGLTWDKSLPTKFDRVDQGKLWWPFHAETVFRQLRSGDIVAIARVDPKIFPALPGTQIPKEADDQFERMVVFRSEDGGANWKWGGNLGTYGEMYPHVLDLFDGHVLLTFTVRALRPPLGVQAVLGDPVPGGFRFDFQNDRMVIDARTPPGLVSGGGFGPTVQLPDGSLVTVYSYRSADGRTHLESARWLLPGQQ